MAKEFDIQVAVTTHFVAVDKEGTVGAEGNEAWVLFFPDRP